MLAKKNRLIKKKDFDKVFNKGQEFKYNFLLLKILENGSEISRFGFIVSKKISKKAVIRNRIRRIMREVIDRRKGEIKKGSDFILIALPGIEKRDFSEIEEVIDKLLSKAGSLAKKISSKN